MRVTLRAILARLRTSQLSTRSANSCSVQESAWILLPLRSSATPLMRIKGSLLASLLLRHLTRKKRPRQQQPCPVRHALVPRQAGRPLLMPLVQTLPLLLLPLPHLPMPLLPMPLLPLLAMPRLPLLPMSQYCPHKVRTVPHNVFAVCVLCASLMLDVALVVAAGLCRVPGQSH